MRKRAGSCQGHVRRIGGRAGGGTARYDQQELGSSPTHPSANLSGDTGVLGGNSGPNICIYSCLGVGVGLEVRRTPSGHTRQFDMAWVSES